MGFNRSSRRHKCAPVGSFPSSQTNLSCRFRWRVTPKLFIAFADFSNRTRKFPFPTQPLPDSAGRMPDVPFKYRNTIPSMIAPLVVQKWPRPQNHWPRHRFLKRGNLRCCGREGIVQSLNYNWSKEFLKAGKKPVEVFGGFRPLSLRPGPLGIDLIYFNIINITRY